MAVRRSVRPPEAARVGAGRLRVCNRLGARSGYFGLGPHRLRSGIPRYVAVVSVRESAAHRGQVDGAPATAADFVAFSYLDVARTRLLTARDDTGFRIEIGAGRRKAEFEGEEARRIAAAIIPRLNLWGGSRRTVGCAVREIESGGHPARFLTRVAELGDQGLRGRSGSIRSMPKSTRLAIEMALHEEQERRALEGELWILERAWKEAEEIAAISDRLLLPAGTDAFFERYG